MKTKIKIEAKRKNNTKLSLDFQKFENLLLVFVVSKNKNKQVCISCFKFFQKQK